MILVPCWSLYILKILGQRKLRNELISLVEGVLGLRLLDRNFKNGAEMSSRRGPIVLY